MKGLRTFSEKIRNIMEKQTNNKTFKIIKKVAKHGSQAIIVIPKHLEEHLKPGTITELNIEVIRGVE